MAVFTYEDDGSLTELDEKLYEDQYIIPTMLTYEAGRTYVIAAEY